MKDFKMIEAMALYGGSFFETIAAAMQKADKDNYAKLVNAFPEEVAKYKAFAARDEAPTTP